MTIQAKEHEVVRERPSIPTPPEPHPRNRKRPRVWLIAAIGIVAIGVGGVFAAKPELRGRAREIYHKTVKQLGGHGEASPPFVAPSNAPRSPWDGLVSIDEAQAKAIGLDVLEVHAQTEPVRIDVNGTTAYDPNAQSQIRPRFSSLIDNVYVELGRTVKTGEPLLDLFSPELAAAKIDYEKKIAQRDFDHRETERSKSLLQTKSIAEKEYLADVNAEKKSEAEARLSLDQLMVYGLSDEEIAKIPKEDGTQKAKMTMRSPANGVVIRRDVVIGNRYDETSVLLVIAPLDHFWVWGNVYPDDASRIKIGQTWVVQCPFAGETHQRTVETIASEIDKETKTLRIGTRIENTNGRLKAEMQVRGYLELPVWPNRTVVSRLAMVSTDGADYVFVRSLANPEKYERRKVRVVQEAHDKVLIAEGLKPGDMVAARGSLLLSQMYEDAQGSETGAP